MELLDAGGSFPMRFGVWSQLSLVLKSLLWCQMVLFCWCTDGRRLFFGFENDFQNVLQPRFKINWWTVTICPVQQLLLGWQGQAYVLIKSLGEIYSHKKDQTVVVYLSSDSFLIQQLSSFTSVESILMTLDCLQGDR